MPVQDKSADNPEIIDRIKKYIDRELERSDIPIVIVMDSADHAEVSVNTTDYIKKIAELYPDATVHHVNLCEQGKLLEEYWDSLPVIAGELNKTAQELHGYLHLITNTLSSHYPVKKQNDECQSLLEKKIEPMLVMAELEGIKLNRGFL
ncbi:MAG: hypothetical protein J6C82_07020 [Clostridia bacterium]|nr:hypothetical protein [Clostridia bacterium]